MTPTTLLEKIGVIRTAVVQLVDSNTFRLNTVIISVKLS
ncbi:MAG: hypothetical protein CM1200mP6_02320 [Anaerolineaceae bacterium]|nr:MAG: hypothetical protein CM1200mP6_02320 [Anaerolineaceae bacterium]